MQNIVKTNIVALTVFDKIRPSKNGIIVRIKNAESYYLFLD